MHADDKIKLQRLLRLRSSEKALSDAYKAFRLIHDTMADTITTTDKATMEAWLDLLHKVEAINQNGCEHAIGCHGRHERNVSCVVSRVS